VVYLATGDWNPDTDAIAIIADQGADSAAPADTAEPGA
jgi:hypothetical protein